MKLHVTETEMKRARSKLGSPTELDEALVATGIDAFFALLRGNEIELADGTRVRLKEVGCGRTED